MPRAAAMFSAVTLLVSPAWGEATLHDRVVTFHTLTYDDPATPLYVARGRTVRVTDGVEFGLEREGVQNGLDVVPVLVNIGETRVEVDFSNSRPGVFASAKFNGYVLKFETDCVLFEGATIDTTVTNLPVTSDAVTFHVGEMHINVSGLAFDQASRLAVDLDVADCPIS